MGSGNPRLQHVMGLLLNSAVLRPGLVARGSGDAKDDQQDPVQQWKPQTDRQPSPVVKCPPPST